MADQRALGALTEEVMSGQVSRRSLLRRAAALGLAVPAMGALLAACGDDEESPAPADPGTDPTPTAAADDDDEEDGDAAETPDAMDDDDDTAGTAEGEAVILQGVDANNLDPLFRNSVPEFTVNMHVLDMMTRRDADTLEIIPNIVESWENVDDLTWEFTLVEGATFHNGDPVNAEAAVFSFERASNTEIGGQGVVQSIARQIHFESAEAIDERTFQVHTSDPAPIILDMMTSFEIMPPAWYEDDSAENLARVAREPMGSGPYQFVEWIPDDRIVLEANEDYWGTPASIQRLIIRPVPELSSRVVALQNNEAQIIVNVAPDVVPQVEESDNARISQVVGGRSIFMGIRCDREPFNDVRVRQALNYGIDWDSIKRALLADAGERMRTIVNPPNDNPDLEAYPYDPELARQLLDEAGVPEGFEVTMHAPNGRYIKDSELAQAIAQGYQEIGINVNLQVLEWSVYAGEVLPSGEPEDLFFLGLGSPFSGQEELYYVHPDFSLNYTRWQNDEYVEKYAELAETLDPDRRQELLYELQGIVMEDCPWVFLWKQVDFYGAAANLDWEARADERIWVAESSFTGL